MHFVLDVFSYTRCGFRFDKMRDLTALSEQYPVCWHMDVRSTLDDEELRIASITRNHAIIAALKPHRAMMPFRHAWCVEGQKNTQTLRYNGELWLQPWAHAMETVTILNYREGCMMMPCETALDYEQKMYYWNVRMRPGPGKSFEHRRMRDIAIAESIMQEWEVDDQIKDELRVKK